MNKILNNVLYNMQKYSFHLQNNSCPLQIGSIEKQGRDKPNPS